MKKFRNILCLILTLALICSQFVTVSAAVVFSDVDPEKSSFSDAIYTLTDFGILKGDAGSDTFRPKANISREEFSVIVDRIMGMGDLNVTVNEYIFTDVTPETCDDWSIKATKIAYDLGIIAGMGDGTFHPKANVTYEQAVKMLVCALGYENVAVAYGGWPEGYMAAAREKGLTKKCEMPQTEPATREVVAQLVYNALDIDLMLAVTTGDKINYIVEKGQTILTQKLRYSQATGVIYGDSNSSLEKLGGYNDGYVAIKKTGETTNTKYLKGNVDTTPYLGKAVKYYYTTTPSGEDQLVAVRELSSNYEVNFLTTDLISLSNTSATYYTDEEQSDRETISINNAKIIFNGQYAENTSLSALAPEISSGNGTLKFIDNNGDNDYDIAIVDLVSVFVVDAIDTTNYRLYDRYDQAKILNLKVSANNKVNITKNNSTLAFSSIKVDDVLLVKESKNSSKVYNIEIIAETETGILSGISSDYTVVQINSTEYDVSDLLVNRYLNDSSLAPMIDDKITAYFNAEGKIVEISSSGTVSNTTYGYIYACGPTNSRNETITLKMFTGDGRFVSAKVNAKVKIDGTPYTYESTLTGDGPTVMTKLAKGQLIEYTLNASGLINNVLTADATKTDTTKYLVPFATSATGAYSSSAKTVGSKVTLNASTKVMFVPTDISDEDEYALKKHDGLKNGATYTYSAYDCTETGVANIILIHGYTASATDAVVAIVDTISNTADAYKLNAYVDGALASPMYTDDSDNDCLDGFKRGDVIKLIFDASGKIKDAKLVFSATSVPAEQATVAQMTHSSRNPSASIDENDYRYFSAGTDYDEITAEYLTIFGTAQARDNERVLVSLFDIDATTDTDGNTIYSLDDTELFPVTFSSTTKFYVIDTTVSYTSPSRLTNGSLNNIAGFASAKSGANRIFAYSKEGKTQFVIILIEEPASN